MRYEGPRQCAGLELQVETLFPRNPSQWRWSAAMSATPRGQIADGGAIPAMLRRGAVWRPASCPERGCRARGLLAKAARAVDDVDEAMERSNACINRWLLRRPKTLR